jgi:hypothetical protein
VTTPRRSQGLRAERDRAIVEAFDDDPTLTLEEVGDRYGITRERVREILVQHGRVSGRKRLQARAEERLFRQFAERARSAVPCAVCGSWVLRRTRTGRKKTCSSECTRLWNEVRFSIDEEERERQRYATATWVVEHADRVPANRVIHAMRVLTGDAEERGRWTISGSKPDSRRAMFPNVPPSAGSGRGPRRHLAAETGKRDAVHS